jgi:PBP1b-binding outer membrane lipoprotein LpoB
MDSLKARFGFRQRAATGTLGVTRRLVFALAVFASALLLSGCAGYQVGPVNGLAAREKSVQINPFVNQTLEPRLTDAVTSQLRKELQRDGTFQLATHKDGDIVVSGTLIRYHRLEVTLSPTDTLQVQDYRLSLTAQVVARERGTGKILIDQPITGYTLIRSGSDLPSAERQAWPLLAGDLARNVTALLAEGKW